MNAAASFSPPWFAAGSARAAALVLVLACAAAVRAQPVVPSPTWSPSPSLPSPTPRPSPSPPASSGPTSLPEELFEIERAASRARLLLASGHRPEAIAALKTAIGRYPEAPTLRWLLARAYLDDRNDFWALRTLAALGALVPDDCEPSLWTAWIHLRQGALDAAREQLASAACAGGTPAAARRTMLWAMLEHHAGHRAAARAHFAKTRGAAAIYAEDREALLHLTRTLDPGYVPPLVARIDLNAGWTSNARAGSPADPAAQGDPDSAAAQTSLWLRWTPPGTSWARPAVEVEARGSGFGARAGRDLSYLALGARPGLLLGSASRRVLLAYHYDALGLAGGDRYEPGPLWFYGAHRGEVELELPPWLTIFGGIGRRAFRELGRSRLEGDGGLGAALDLTPALRLLGAMSGRWHDAEKDPYDLRGGALVLSAHLRSSAQWSVRAGLLASYDVYPRSAGYFDVLAPETARRDTLLKISAAVFSPTWWRNLEIGVGYEHAWRSSTAAPYAYRSHRLLVRLLGTFSLDPSLPRVAAPAGHVALDYGLSAAALDERIQDLLRQDEAAQRSSACIE